MRRQIIIGLLIMVCWGITAPNSFAQHYFYHNVGDTVFRRDTIYYYGWWVDDWIDPDSNDLTHEIMTQITPTGQFFSADHQKCSEMNQYFYTDRPLDIIGLAFCATKDAPNGSDTMIRSEYVMLYDATPDSFALKKKIEWHIWDTHRYYFARQQSGVPPYFCTGNPYFYDWYFPLYEYYFEDKPITVTDSFYVGVTSNSYNNQRDESGHYYPFSFPVYCSWEPGYSAMHHIWLPNDPQYTNCPIVPPAQRLKRWCLTDNCWEYTAPNRVLFVFPIVLIDTLALIPPDTTHYVCPEVQRLRFVGGQDGTVWLLWNENSTEHVGWQTSFGEAGFTPEAGIIDSVSGNPIGTLNGLDSCVRYEAYVRAVCTHDDSTYYSNWTGPVRIYLCDTLSGGDIDTTGTGGDDTLAVTSPGDLDRLTQLIPNPAGEEVRVESSLGLQSVEVLDMKGQSLLRRETHGESTVIDVKQWASGVYIVIVRTPAGLATKKLVVSERP